ncbi:30S ribosomal protein S20 [Patescibacteria group bacterium]
MPNTKAAKKAVRSSKTKQTHNLYWKTKFKGAVRDVKEVIAAKADSKVIEEKLRVLQKTLDRAVREKVIHKNKASRVKSRYAKKAAAQAKPAKPKKAGPKASKSD